MIDNLKALSIMAVIVLHAWPSNPLSPILGLAVPLFILIMGYNAYGSFQRRFKVSLIQFYPSYLWGKAKRYIPPMLAMVFLAALLAGENPILKMRYAITGIFHMSHYPLPGPGGYFVPLIFQFCIIFPILAFCYSKHPRTTIILSLIMNIAFLLSQSRIDFPYFHASIIQFIYLVIMGFGIHDRMKTMPKFRTPLSEIGRASYHIFIFQCVVFAIAPLEWPLLVAVVCLLGGYGVYLAMNWGEKIYDDMKARIYP